MKEIKEIAANYAAGKTNEVMDKAIAQAYADGYRNGYKDREEEIPVDLRDNKTEYVDLGLPSGTLWSTDYEEEGGKTKYLRFSDSHNCSIPTKEQWEELCKICKWERIWIDNKFCRTDCIGPKGKISFYPKGIITNELINDPDLCYFWLNDSTESLEKPTSFIGYYNGVALNTTSKYLGYKLPIRLVKVK